MLKVQLQSRSANRQGHFWNFQKNICLIPQKVWANRSCVSVALKSRCWGTYPSRLHCLKASLKASKKVIFWLLFIWVHDNRLNIANIIPNGVSLGKKCFLWFNLWPNQIYRVCILKQIVMSQKRADLNCKTWFALKGQIMFNTDKSKQINYLV